MTTKVLLKLRCRVWERQLPKVITLTDFDPSGVRFEAAGVTELHRIVNLGDEKDYLSRMLAELTPGDVLYDIGANIGLVAFHAGGRCRTVAFEPDPAFVTRLRRNMQLNTSLSVVLLPVAISDHDGAATLFTDGSEGTSPSLVHQRSETGTAQVQARTLDALMEEANLPKPTVLKLDIEGAEILALRGGARLLQGDGAPRLLFLEIHDAFLPAFGSSAEEVLALVHQAGYDRMIYKAIRGDQQHLILGRS